MELNFPKLEQKILKFWRESRVFEKSVNNRAKARDFVFYEGPPTANGRPGIHHVLARSFKDVICRYKTMRGFRVLRKAGWDTHGLPVEIEVEKQLGLKSKKEIEKYGIAKFNAKCRQSVWKYKTEWENLTERIGYWLDMKNPYVTYENDYIETLWWIIKRIWGKGFLYQDYKVVPYCPRCGTSLSSHEVALGYKSVKESAIYVKFKLIPNTKYKIQTTSLLVWTTTPWTLPGNVAVAANPKLDYVLAEFGNEKFILAKERISVLGENCKILEELKGNDLLDLEYEAPFNFVKPEKKSHFIIAGDFVSADEGTGLVHIAPAFGEDDMKVAKENNLPVLMTVDESGKFKTEIKNWSGMFVKDADPLIIEDLKYRGLLFKEEKYEHDYPFCWRCDSPLLYYAKESWFIKMSALKNQLIENNQKINWVPKHLKEGRFGEWLKEVKDWAFSRERYWGTPLPIWQCQNKNQKPKTKNQKYKSNSKNQKSGCGYATVIGSKEDLLAQKFSSNQYFIMRHGYAPRGQRISCWPEKFHSALNKEGRESVKKMIPFLKKQKIDFIIASDVIRTRQTAEIVAKELKLKIKFDPRIRELNMGIFNGKLLEDFYKVFSSREERFTKRPTGGENWNDCKMRMIKFIRDIDRKYKQKRILIVSHGDPLWLLEGAMKGLDNRDLLKIKAKKKCIKTGEVRKIEFRGLPYNNDGDLDFHRPYIDTAVFECPQCGGKMERAKEIIDVWFDSGAMPFAQNPRFWAQNKKSLLRQGYGGQAKIKNQKLRPPDLFPADYICEAVDQTRGWFYTLLAISTLLGFESPYKNAISVGHVLDEKGEKMSKSKGNVVDPWYIAEKYGSDALRWYFYTVNQPGDSKLFAEKDVDQALKKFILTLWNSFIFFQTYAGKNQKPKTKNQKLDKRRILKYENVLDKWIIARFNALIAQVTDFLEKYDITSAARAIENFTIEDLSNWYIRRSRRRFQRPESHNDFDAASQTLEYVLANLSVMCAPFIPFLSEEIYKKTRGNTSVHLADWPESNRKLIERELLNDMNFARTIVAQALKARAQAGIKVRQPLRKLKIKYQKLKIIRELLDLIKDEVNVKEVIFDSSIAELVELDIMITLELREEGIARDIVRQVQEMRKECAYKPHHKISLQYHVSSGLEDLWHRWENYLRTEIQAQKIIERPSIHQQKKESFDREREIQIDGEKIWLGIKKY